jgi:hypothetical protein
MRRATVLAASAAVLLLPACNLLIPITFLGDHKKKITAEFDKLANNRAVVLVWTPPETLFDYPHARLELATYVRDKLAEELATRKRGVDLVDAIDVEDFIRAHPEAEVNPRQVGRHFSSDYVVYVEVVEFQIRDAAQPQLLQGRVSASVVVHAIRTDPDLTDSWELNPVQTLYPETPQVMTATNALVVREQVYRKFAEEVARKFHDYTVDL